MRTRCLVFFSSWLACTCLLEIEPMLKWADTATSPLHGLQLYRKVAVFRPIFHNGHVIKPPGKRVHPGCEVLLFPPQPLITSTKHPGHANALAFHLFFLPCCSSLLFSSSMLHLVSCLLPFRFSLSVVHF